MKIVEFRAKHLLSNDALSFGGRPVQHQDGRPVIGGELVPGKVYAVAFDEGRKGPAVLVTVQENRAKRRADRRRP